MVETRAARRKREHLGGTPLTLDSLWSVHLDDTRCAMHLVLQYCSAATILRLCHVWRADSQFRFALQARRRTLKLPPLETDLPLSSFFVDELRMLLHSCGTSWREEGGFVPFRLRESDGNGSPDARLIVCDSDCQWLADAYDPDAGVMSQPRSVNSYWLQDGSAVFGFTQHLALHPRFGRVCKRLCDLDRQKLQTTFATYGFDKWLAVQGSGYKEFERDSEMDDLAVLLSRLHFDSQFRCRYGKGTATQPFWEDTVHRLLCLAPSPHWARRPEADPTAFLHEMFSFVHARSAHNDTSLTSVLMHKGVGDVYGVWFVATLGFFDAIEKISQRPQA